MFFLNLCKEDLNVAKFKILVSDEELNVYMRETPFCVIVYTSYKIVKWSQLFGPPYTLKKQKKTTKLQTL